MSDYFNIPAASASLLKELARSPYHAWAKYIDPARPADEPTPAMLLGTQTHAAILEPAEFDNRYTVMPEGLDRRTKEGKAVYAAIIESGKQPVANSDMSYINAMRESVHAHPFSRELWSLPHRVETPHYVTMHDTRCKMKPDMVIWPNAVSEGKGIIIDLKTTTDASPAAFGKSAWSLAYYIQAAFYTDCFKAHYSIEPTFYWLAVESKYPHACAYYSAPEHLIEYGRDVYMPLLETYKECVATGDWPAYPKDVSPLELPAWATNAMTDQEQEIKITTVEG